MESIPKQQETLKKIEEDRPLDAEKDENRKLAYIQRQIKCSLSVARRIADNENPATLPLNEAQIDKAESLQGDTVDFVPICFLDVARAATGAITRNEGKGLAIDCNGVGCSNRRSMSEHLITVRRLNLKNGNSPRSFIRYRVRRLTRARWADFSNVK